MRKAWYLLPIALLVGSGMVAAQQPQQPQKQAKPSAKNAPPVTSVKAAVGAADERRVQLQGKIVAHRGKNVYVLEDETGKIPLVIVGKVVPAGQQLRPGVPVHITGHVDRDSKGGPRVMVSSAKVGGGNRKGGGQGD